MLSVKGLRRPELGDNDFGPVDLEVSAGEVVALRGPSGVGKSVLLRAIADLDPSQGTVALDGSARENFSGPHWRSQVGYLPPESGWWESTVAPHFADAGAARELLPALGLGAGSLDWSVMRLSSGEKQRLALVRLLIQGPAILLLDEPTAALDGEARRAAETVIRGRAEAGAGVLMITHDDAQAQRIADRVLIKTPGGVEAA